VLHGGGPSLLEDAVRADDDVDWTVLMPVEFMANCLEWADGIVASGEVREPFVSRLSAMVHEGDIGAVAAVVLTEEGHGGQEYVITGPELLTVGDKVATIAAARGREIALVELSEELAVAQWRAAGHPEDVIGFLIEAYGNTRRWAVRSSTPSRRSPATRPALSPSGQRSMRTPSRQQPPWSRHSARMVRGTDAEGTPSQVTKPRPRPAPPDEAA
jgi:hypothetical protein